MKDVAVKEPAVDEKIDEVKVSAKEPVKSK